MLTNLKRRLRKNRKLYRRLGYIFGFYRNSVLEIARRIGGMNDNMVVFSAFDCLSYNDNPRYISEALHELRPETDIVWLFKDGKKARERLEIPDYVRVLHSIRLPGVCAMARACVVVDNFNKRFYLNFPGKDQIYIQTWHADRAFKKVGYDNPQCTNTGIEKRASLGITGSDYGDMQFRSAFHYEGELLRVGSPRNDILIRNDPAEAAAIRKKLGIDDDTQLLMYAPTFRDVDHTKQRAQKVPLRLPHVLETLEKSTGKKWKCLVRAHYLSEGLSLEDKNDPRLINVSKYQEMAELLLISDALLTDYSSCAGDFILLRRPVFLYQEDLEEYTTANRALYFNMKDSPYWVASTPDELDRLIETSTPERAKQNCDDILRFYGENETGEASKRVAEYIVSKLK